MKNYLIPLILFSVVMPTMAATVYTDSKLPVRFQVPAGWKVRPGVVDGKHALRVIPNKADQRERAAIEVIITRRTLKPKQTMTKYAEEQRGDSEALSVLGYEWKKGRLETDFRGGQYVDNGLWIVRQTKMVLQRIEKTSGIIDARCAANAAEYRSYRRALESICKSIEVISK